MTVSPRTPVLVGVGQVNHVGGDAPEPFELLAEAARRAVADAGPDRLFGAIESIRVVRILTRRYRDPGALVAERIGAAPSHRAVSTDGGNSPQMLINQTALDIQRGDLDVALIGGAESWKTRMTLKSRRENPSWTFQPDSVPLAEVMGAAFAMSSRFETELGLVEPVQVYPLFEMALGADRGWPLDVQRAHIGELWARFSDVASRNPAAALRQPVSANDVAQPGPGNRMIGFPYTKLLCSNNSVDQAAALVLCSAERASALGVPPDRWVFLHSGAQAQDTPAVSNRASLARSPAIRLAGRAALELAGVGPDDLGRVDLYSCFPSAVQIAAAELGLSGERALTVTGGLTFAGGPWNNYVSHSVATMVGLLREQPHTYGLCSANGGFLTKHTFGIYAAHPPDHDVQVADVQAEVDALPGRELAEHHVGPATVEAYTVMHERDGRPQQAFVACLLDDGRRTWATSTAADMLAALLSEQWGGRKARIGPGAEVVELS